MVAVIPYFAAPSISLGFLRHVPLARVVIDETRPPSLSTLTLLGSLGVVTSSTLALIHAQQRGLNPQRMSGFLAAVVVCGLFVGHVGDVLRHWPQAIEQPFYWVEVWHGQSSVGAVLGATVGALAWARRTGSPILPYADVVSSAFPLTLLFGRLGCALAHDHPGRVTNAWFAVRYPTAVAWEGRYDLGLYEFLLILPVAITFALLWRHAPRRVGFYTGWLGLLYAPMRFSLDFLRAPEGSSTMADPRFLSLTPAQWGCLALAPVAVAILHHHPRERLLLNTERGPSART